MSETIEIDLVTAAVIRSAMETVCFEMATYVSRTATTPILNQSNERNATILDGQGRLAALSVGIPQFMLSSTLPVRFAIDFFGDELKPGDVIVAVDQPAELLLEETSLVAPIGHRLVHAGDAWHDQVPVYDGDLVRPAPPSKDRHSCRAGSRRSCWLRAMRRACCPAATSSSRSRPA